MLLNGVSVLIVISLDGEIDVVVKWMVREGFRLYGSGVGI